MANVRVADATRDVMMNAFNDQSNLGSAAIINIYSGVQPVNADTALSGNVLLATLTASALMWGVSANGVLTLNAVAPDVSADASGIASFARVLTQGGGATIFDCDVGTSGATIIFNTTTFIAGGTISITSGTMTFPPA